MPPSDGFQKNAGLSCLAGLKPSATTALTEHGLRAARLETMSGIKEFAPAIEPPFPSRNADRCELIAGDLLLRQVLSVT
jgi:hypothetical protein